MAELLSWWDGKTCPTNTVHPSTMYKQGCGDPDAPAFFSKAVVKLIENQSSDQKQIRQFVANLLHGFRMAVNVMVAGNVKLFTFNVLNSTVRLFAHKIEMQCGDSKGPAWVITIK